MGEGHQSAAFIVDRLGLDENWRLRIMQVQSGGGDGEGASR